MICSVDCKGVCGSRAGLEQGRNGRGGVPVGFGVPVWDGYNPVLIVWPENP